MNTAKPYHKRTPAEKEDARRHAVAALARGESITKIAEAYGVSRQTVHNWREAAADPERGLARRPNGPPCALTDEQLARLADMLEEGALKYGFPNDLWTVARVTELVRRTFGVAYAPRSMWHVLRVRMGFTPQRPQRVPREADPDEKARWKCKFRRRGGKDTC